LILADVDVLICAFRKDTRIPQDCHCEAPKVPRQSRRRGVCAVEIASRCSQ
jgi:hypothetical protein